MTTRRSSVVTAAAALVAYLVAGAAVLAIGGAGRQGLEDAGKHALVVVQSIGHGTLQLDQGFIAAMGVSLIVAPLPVIARVLMFRLPRAIAHAVAVVVVLGAVIAATALGKLSHQHAISVAIACVVGLAFGILVSVAMLSLAALRGHETGGPTGRSRIIAVVLMVLYVVAVVLIAFHGSPVDAGGDHYLFSALNALHRSGVPAWVAYDAVEFSANIVYFAPLGVLVTLLIGVRRWWAPILIGFVASSFIEIVQALFLPRRDGSVDDVLANTAGALLGTLIGIVALRRLGPRTASRPNRGTERLTIENDR